MKISYLATLGLALVLVSGCQKRSGNIWEDNQTGARYSHENAASLWGNSSSSEKDGLAGPVEEDFVPLSDQDLKNQFADGAAMQPAKSLGDAGMPSAEAFEAPSGELASVFHPVFFNTDDHILRGKDYLETVGKMASYLKEHPHTTVIIEGHADERAPEAYNLALGARRANYVRTLLIKQGVNPDQLHTISYGKERPFALGHGPDAWAQNRRAHFRVHTNR